MLRLVPTLLLLLLTGLAAPVLADRPSRLEHAYGERAGEALRQYGYDLFAFTGPRVEPALGTVADSHLLGPGDELTVTLRGQSSGQGTHKIGSDGLLIVDGLRPLAAAGRSLGEVRAELEAEVAATLFDTRAFLTLASPRRLSVLVLGEVNRPGLHDLSAFATVLDALFAAGGISSGGSLRAIRLVHPGEASPGILIDLYELLHQGGGGADARLVNGARIVVPPLGPTVAIAGQVQRPGVVELPVGAVDLPVAEALRLAGGPLRPGRMTLHAARVAPDGSERVIELGGQDSLVPGDVLLLAPGRADRRASVTLAGHVHNPGPRPLTLGGGIGALLADRAARDDAFRPFAVLAGINPATGARHLRAVAFTPEALPRAPALADGDTLVLFGPEEVAFLTSAAVLRLLRSPDPMDDTGRSDGVERITAPVPSGEQNLQRPCAGLQALALRLAADRDGSLAAGARTAAAASLTGPELPCPPLFAEQPDLLPFALEHAVLIRTGVLRPGLYPAAPGVPIAELVVAAGGAGDGASRMAGEIVDAGEPWIEVLGAVRDPGRIPLRRAPTLRALLRADALADDAFGLFAVIDRTDRQGSVSTLIPFAPAELLAGGADQPLRDGDRILILSREEARALAAPPGSDEELPVPGPAAIRRLAGNSAVSLRGAVAEPGHYPVAGTPTPGALIAAAGGLLPQADTEVLEIIASHPDMGSSARLVRQLEMKPLAASPPRTVSGTQETVQLRPGDAVRVPRREAPMRRGTITLAGEVRDPGDYDLMPGETLSSVLARAGGLLPTAYPLGAVFTRESARRVEREQLNGMAREVEQALLHQGKEPPEPSRLAEARQLLEDLRAARPLGRITVEADPAVLAVQPELDVVLEAGDRLHVPKRPLTVAVRGEVLSPANLQFVPGKGARTYLAEAGGLTRQADAGRIFVLLPNGSARPLSTPHRHGLDTIPPGSSIIVPRDPDPFDFLKVSQSVTSILSQLALSAAVIVSITE